MSKLITYVYSRDLLLILFCILALPLGWGLLHRSPGIRGNSRWINGIGVLCSITIIFYLTLGARC